MKKRVLIMAMLVALGIVYSVEAAPNCQQYDQFSKNYRVCACMARGFSERCCSLEGAAVNDPGCLAEASGATRTQTVTPQQNKESTQSAPESGPTYKKVYKSERACFEGGIDSEAECLEYAKSLYAVALKKRALCRDNKCRNEWTAAANQIVAAARDSLKDSRKSQKVPIKSTGSLKTKPVKTQLNKNLQRSSS
ncbi:hypothetical protein J4211_05695 [Candidatus Woesearchaeota archaeon]|nr:hypothetical protein [Candidatus Woesearchaeota archaeon]